MDIIDGTGKVLETFQVEIKGSKSYPYAFPKLYETNNAFPKNVDWHVYVDDFSCCIDVPMNEKIICQNGLNVVEYIKQFAIPYLANQSFRRREGYYLYGEYSHGFMGRLEFYQSRLKASSPMQLLQMFKFIIQGFDPDRRATCPFCSKEKFRRCHRDVFRDFKTIKYYIVQDGSFLLKILKINPNFQLPST